MSYLPLASGIVALGIEVTTFLSLMELPPFGKGDSDIIWGLPLIGLVVLLLAVPGLGVAINAKKNPEGDSRLALTGVITNGLALAGPLLILLLGILRGLLATGPG